jgi:gas vesicle protein
MGKSRLGNVILGGDRLPTSYQPATSVICLIRHVSEKPDWQAEFVWMMGKGFDLDKADDEEHCKQYKLCGGGFDALKQYGTHTSINNEHKAVAAIVYADAPLLLGCDMLDLPGYGHSHDDQERAEMGHKMVDMMLYLSTAQGFLDQNDLNYLSVLIRHLPTYESPERNISPLRNLMIVATRSDIVGDQINGILNTSCVRAYKHLDNVIAERAQLTGVPITEEDFRQRFFAFSADNPGIRIPLENDLKDILINVLPDYTLNRMNNHVQIAKSAATAQCDQWINGLKLALNEREQAQGAVKWIQDEEASRLDKKQAHEQRIFALISQLKRESGEIVSSTFSNLSSVESIELMIKKRYDDKKEAQQLAGSYLLETIQKKITDAVQIKANHFGKEVDIFLGEYNTAIENNTFINDNWDFNPRATFMGALAGISTFGALATWASIAAAGSNLGAYILIPTVVSFLSSIGIGVGGTSAAISLVSTLGGPITIGVAIAIGAALLVASLFGDSWQKKLAKKIRDNAIEQQAEDKIRISIDKYWDDTKSAFTQAVAETESSYIKKLDSLHTLAFSTSRDLIEIELKFAQEIRDFFGGMPWRTIKS